MKSASKRVLALLLMLALVVSLFGCAETPEAPGIKQEGIVITPEVPYSAEVLARSEEILYPLILRFVEKSGLFLTPTLKEHYRTVASEVAAILAKNPVDEDLYTVALEAIESRGETVVDELAAYAKGKGDGLGEVAVLYRQLVSLFDSRAVLDVIYDLVLYSFDYRYRDAMAKYEQYKREKFKQEAEAVRKEKRIVTDEIGRQAFYDVVSQTLALADLFVGGALESELLDTFSDEEILAFLRRLEIRRLSVTDVGWVLILETLTPAAQGENATYAQRLWARARENGDFTAIAGACNDLSEVSAAIVSHLTASDIAEIRNGDYEAAVAAALARFTDAQWECLSRIGAVELRADDYHAVAAQVYGAAYVEYAESLLPVSAEQLRASIDTENFYESLERFVGGISPAFSYGMRK